MPGSKRSLRGLSVAAALVGLQAAAVGIAARAMAAPTPTPTPSPSASDDACDLIRGPAKDYCEGGEGAGSRTQDVPSTDALDPLSSLARGCADAASWIVGKLSEAVESTANVDFTNPKFLQQYAVIFAASTILTLVLWLLAVAKRAIRGVPLTTAISEAVGFLWLTVLASAFTPLILYTIVSATDGVTEIIASATGGQTDVFFGSFAEALKKGEDIGGGPIMLIVVSLVSILAAWHPLARTRHPRRPALRRRAPRDRRLRRSRRQEHVGPRPPLGGIMIAVIMVKPVIVIVLGLAGALSTGDGPDAFSAVVSGLSIILLAIFASAMIYRFVPGFGDEIQGARTNRKQATDGSQAAALISSPAALVSQGIKTHSGRTEQSSGGGGARPANPASGGVAAHSSRTSGGGGTGGSSGGSAAPSPRSGSAPTSGTPHSSRSSRGGGGFGSTGNSNTGGGGR